MPNRPSCTQEIKQLLLAEHDCVDYFHLDPNGATHYDLFTDGSCQWPKDHHRSLASWAVVLATHNACLSAGPVCGLIQSINRAELTAALSALTWTYRYSVRVTLWTDSAYVAQGISRLLVDGGDVPDCSHHDLWLQIVSLLQALPASYFQVTHVASHGKPEHCQSPLDDWILRWNAAADTAAKHAQLHRSAHFWSTWHRYETELLASYQAIDILRPFHLELAAERQRLLGTLVRDEEADEDIGEREVLRQFESGNSWVLDLPASWQEIWKNQPDAFSFGTLFPLQFVKFLQDESDASTGLDQLSWLELAVALHVEGLKPPFPAPHGGWQDYTEVGTHTDSVLSAAVRVRYVRSLTRRFVDLFEIEHPWSANFNLVALGVHCPLSGLRLAMSPSTLKKVDGFLQAYTTRRPIKRVGDLARPF